MAYVMRDDGTQIEINDKISKTKFDLPNDEDISDAKILAQISEAIERLEKYGKLVDNCGYSNCCQSCQQACSECAGECKECIENGCSQCLNCKEEDPRKIVALPKFRSGEPYLTRNPDPTEADGFVHHSAYDFISQDRMWLSSSGSMYGNYYNNNQEHKVNWWIKNKEKARWDGEPDDYVHTITWHVKKAIDPVPVVFRLTSFVDNNYDRYHESFVARTISRIAVIENNQVIEFKNAAAIGGDKHVITKKVSEGHNYDRTIVEFFVPGITNEIRNFRYFHYSGMNEATSHTSNKPSGYQVPLQFGTIQGGSHHSIEGRFMLSNIYDIRRTSSSIDDMRYFWTDISYIGINNVGEALMNQVQKDTVKSIAGYSFDITDCDKIGVPAASYTFVIANNWSEHLQNFQGEDVTGSLYPHEQILQLETGNVTVNGPADIIKYEGMYPGDYNRDINMFNYTVV